MRQAGRYLPEYMELRAKYPFLERCYNPEIAAEITLQPLRRFDFDAGIIFSDILLPLHKMGADLHYRQGVGPQIDNPVRSIAAIDALFPLIHGAIFDPNEGHSALQTRDRCAHSWLCRRSIYHGLLSGRGRRF